MPVSAEIARTLILVASSGATLARLLCSMSRARGAANPLVLALTNASYTADHWSAARRLNYRKTASWILRSGTRLVLRGEVGPYAPTVVKRLLQDALAAEGELELTPRPKPKRVFERITTIADDAC